MRRSAPLLTFVCLFLLLPALAAIAAPQQALQQERRVALVIGNGAYKERYFGQLTNPVNDARDMAAALTRFGFDVIHKENASKREIVDAIRELGKKLKQGGIGLFYFAGHGIQSQNVNYLIPVKANILNQADLEDEAVNAERVLREMTVADNGFNIVILDACRANMEFPGQSRAGGGGLAEMRAPTGSLIAYATSPGSFAADGQGKNGTYTENLLRRMKTPGLPVELMFKQVRTDVAKVTGNQQIPWEHSSLIGDFSFAAGQPVATLGPGGGASATPAAPVMPPPPVAKPGKGGVDLGDIDAGAEARSKAEAAAKKDWAARLKAMQADYAKVQAVEKSPKYAAAERAKAWEKFLAAYADKNPYTDQDQALRDKARAQKDRWAGEAQKQAEAAQKLAQAKADAEAAAQAKKQQQLLALAPVPKQAPGAAPASGSPGQTWRDPVTQMEFVWVPGGSFEMGCGSWAGDCFEEEKPAHSVRLSGFWLGKFEVTQGQWQRVMGNNPSNFKKGDNYPVEQVSWNDAKEFITKLNAQGSAKFRLPTEAEWEYAARSGGRPEMYAGGEDIDRVAWYGSNSGGSTHAVGTKAPNGLGLYDMSGNVWEWVEDVYGGYSSSSQDNPVVTGGGSYRVRRGGSWTNGPRGVRSALRFDNTPGFRDDAVGFRLARTN